MTDATSPVIHSTPATLLGAALGGVVSWLLVRQDEGKGAYGKTTGWGFTALGTVVGGLIGRGISAQPNPTAIVTTSIPPQGATPFLQTALPQSTDVTVVPGGNLSIAIDVGTIVIVWLPLGGRWVSFDGAPAPDPVVPDTFLFQGPIAHTYVWTDSQNKTQTCVISFTVGVSTPIVTT
jgi:hypothetical protein